MMADKKNKGIILIIVLVVLAGCALLACLIAVGLGYFFYFNTAAKTVSVMDEVSAAPVADLTGIWQQNGSMAAGWADRYHFYPSGTFHFYPNEMICPKEKIQKIGTWSLDGSTLTLTTTRQIVTTYEESTGAFCTKIDTTEAELARPLIEQYTVADHGTVPGDIYPSISIGDVQFWKFSDDASRYGEEEFQE